MGQRVRVGAVEAPRLRLRDGAQRRDGVEEDVAVGVRQRPDGPAHVVARERPLIRRGRGVVEDHLYDVRSELREDVAVLELRALVRAARRGRDVCLNKRAVGRRHGPALRGRARAGRVRDLRGNRVGLDSRPAECPRLSRGARRDPQNIHVHRRGVAAPPPPRNIRVPRASSSGEEPTGSDWPRQASSRTGPDRRQVGLAPTGARRVGPAPGFRRALDRTSPAPPRTRASRRRRLAARLEGVVSKARRPVAARRAA